MCLLGESVGVVPVEHVMYVLLVDGEETVVIQEEGGVFGRVVVAAERQQQVLLAGNVSQCTLDSCYLG